MKPKFTAQQRLQLIERILNGESISKVINEVGISRVLFYRWLKKYKEKGEKGLSPQAPGRPRKTKALEKKGKFVRLSAYDRLQMIRDIEEDGESVSKVAKRLGTSRTTVYKWIQRYKGASEKEKSEALEDKKPRVEFYFRQTPEKYEEAVLSLVAKHPEYGIRNLLINIPKIGNTPVVGHHGIQNILRRHGLSHYEARLAYAKSQITPAISVTTDILSYVQRFFSIQYALRNRIIRFVAVASFSALLTVIVFGLGAFLTSSVLQAPGVDKIGMFFAVIALFMGSVFFLYSLKYYITLAIVLSFSQGEYGPNFTKGKKGNLLSWILGIGKDGSGNGGNGKVGPVGLEPNLDHVYLKRYPFVSIHIPFYNEKNVVERAIAASTNFDYKGEYEVILCDDSTDETSTIIRDYQKRYIGKGESLKVEGSSREGWTLTQIEVSPGVTLKHLHRTSRKGFKGGALREALRHTDPRAEFVSVFDADFVPYPDTLTLFLKYFKVQNNLSEQYQKSNVAAVQGYQWHVLNKSENWITRGVRSEYAGSYVIERSGEEIYQGLKQISGSVYMVRKDILNEIGWGDSITEDFELTLKLYEAGYKVVYTPYIQAPAECVSTIKRLIRQRMRWAEGHSQNVKKMFKRLIFNPNLTFSEKVEFLYLSPYYLQAFFFLVGTLSWLISETVFRTHLPFWTSLWGWSLVLTNLFALPLMNAVGLFLEESEEKDYAGTLSFVALSYIVVPFQAYASLKGFLESSEGPWFRTPKTGRITDIFTRGRFYRFIAGILPGRAQEAKTAALSLQTTPNPYLALSSANNSFSSFMIRSKNKKWLGRAVISFYLVLSTSLVSFAPYIESISTQEVNQALPGGGVILSPEGKNSLLPTFQLPDLIKEVHAKDDAQSPIDTSNTSFEFETEGLRLTGQTKDFKATESPSFVVYQKDSLFEKILGVFKKTSQEDELGVRVFNSKGEAIKNIFMTKDGKNSHKIELGGDLKPGEYSLIVQDEKGHGLIQDFTWGVLAINTNKSIYLPGETAKFSIAVLDEVGAMVCDAKLDLRIKKPVGEEITLTTENGSIEVTPGCSKKEVILSPDYSAEYPLEKVGTYDLTLKAITQNGEHTITDKIEVKSEVDFDVERTAATRIYPVDRYPFIIKVKANKDFKGEVNEWVPGQFQVWEARSEYLSKFGIDVDLEKGLLAKMQAKISQGKKVLSWFVNWEAGSTYYLAYEALLPPQSPAFYLSGPLQFGDFSEARRWQMAVDDQQTLRPNANGQYSYWSGNYTDVNDQSDSTFISCTSSEFGCDSPTHKRVMNLDNTTFSGSDTINWVQTNARCDARGSGPAEKMDILIRTNDTDYIDADGVAIARSGFADYSGIQRATNPNTGNPWTKTEVDALQAGIGYDQLFTSELIDCSEVWVVVDYTPSGGGFNVSGTVYLANETTTATTGNGGQCNSSTQNLSLRVNGGTASTQSCSSTNGSFTFTGVSATSGDTITIYSTDSTDKSNRVYVSDGTVDTGMNLYKDTLAVGDEPDGTVTIADLADYDNDQNPGDMLFDADTSPSVFLLVDSGVELHVHTGDTLDPGGDVDTQGAAGDLHIDDNGLMEVDTATSTFAGDVVIDAGATWRVNANSGVDGGDITTTTTGATTTTTGTPTVTVTGAGTLGGGSGTLTFYNLSLSGTGTSTLNSPLTTNNNLTVGDGSNSHTLENETNDEIINVDGGLTISANGTLTASSTASFTVQGDWTNSGTLNEGTGTVTFDGTISTTLNSGCTDASACTSQNFSNLIINKTSGTDANDNVTLSTNHLRVTTLITITDGELVQGALNVRSEGTSAVSIAAAGKWTNISTGDLTLGGSFDNSGTATFQGNGSACGDANDILLRSTAAAQRSWTGSGTFNVNDADIQYQAGTASITAFSSTDSGNNGSNWDIQTGCGPGVSTSTSQEATAWSFQRKTFYDSTNDRYWEFFYDGDSIEGWISSNDGDSWTDATGADLAVNTNDFSLWHVPGDTYVYIAYAISDDIRVRRGTLSTTDITWGTEYTALDGTGATASYKYANISRDTSGLLWITARYASASTSNATYYFDAYNAGEAWSTNPANMVDGSTSTFASSATNGQVQLNNSNTSTGSDLGTITTVEIRAHGYSTNGDDIYLRPVFGGTSDGSNWTYDLPVGSGNAAYSSYFDITTDTNAPSTWTWTDVDNLDMDVQQVKVAAQDESFISRVEVRVSYVSTTNYYMRATRCGTADDPSCSWGTPDNLSDTTNTNTNVYGVIVPEASQDMYVVWIRNAAIEGRQWDDDAAGDKWDPDLSGAADSIATGKAGLASNLSLVSDTSRNVQLVYVDSLDRVQHQECTAVCSGSFGAATRLDGATANEYVTVSVNSDNNDVYAIWLRSGVAYYNARTGGTWDGETNTNWIEGTSPKYLSSNFSGPTRIFATWTSGNSSPFDVNWDSIIIPEYLWLFMPLAPFLPLLLRARRKKAEVRRLP